LKNGHRIVPACLLSGNRANRFLTQRRKDAKVKICFLSVFALEQLGPLKNELPQSFFLRI
jgi:hypothetical protein